MIYQLALLLLVSRALGKPASKPEPKPVPKPALKPCHPGCMTHNMVLKINNRPYFDYKATFSDFQYVPPRGYGQDNRMVVMNRMAPMNSRAGMNLKIPTSTMVGMNRMALLNRIYQNGKKSDY